mgnify:CR=1 FL=1
MQHPLPNSLLLIIEIASENSFTSMTLARDTYGLHVKDEGNSNEQLKKESGLIFN